MNALGREIKCHPQDLEWVVEQLKKIPFIHLIDGVVNSYSKCYDREGTLKEKGLYRREANTKLRNYVRRVNK